MNRKRVRRLSQENLEIIGFRFTRWPFCEVRIGLLIPKCFSCWASCRSFPVDTISSKPLPPVVLTLEEEFINNLIIISQPREIEVAEQEEEF